MRVLLDPWSLTWPSCHFVEKEAEEYVEYLTRLFELSREEVLLLYVSDECVDLLIKDGAYPLIEQIPKPLWPNRSDVYRLVTSLLEKLPKLERLGITAVLVDQSSSEPRMEYSSRHEAHLHELSAVALVAAERSAIPVPSILSSTVLAGCEHKFSLIVADVECVAPPQARLGNYNGAISVRPTVARCVLDWMPADLLVRGFVEGYRSFGLAFQRGAGLEPFRSDWMEDRS